MNKIKCYREILGLTLEEIAKETELSIGYLSHLESGSRKNPTKEVMGKISNALGKTVPEVFYAENTPSQEKSGGQTIQKMRCEDMVNKIEETIKMVISKMSDTEILEVYKEFESNKDILGKTFIIDEIEARYPAIFVKYNNPKTCETDRSRLIKDFLNLTS